MLHDPRSATIVCWHPDLGSQLSTVQGSPSSQLSGVPAVQTPARHVSTPLQMLPSPHDASERHCGVVGVVVVVGVVTVVVVMVGVGPVVVVTVGVGPVVVVTVVVVTALVVVVLVVVVVVVGGGHTGGAGTGEDVSTGPFTMSPPAPGGPAAQPHQFPRASISVEVVLSTPNGAFPAMLLLVAVATALGAPVSWRRRMPASVAADMVLHVSVPFESAVLLANETTRIPTFPGATVLGSRVASPSSRTMPSNRLSMRVLPLMVVPRARL